MQLGKVSGNFKDRYLEGWYKPDTCCWDLTTSLTEKEELSLYQRPNWRGLLIVCGGEGSTPLPPTRCTERLDTQWLLPMSKYRKPLRHNIYCFIKSVLPCLTFICSTCMETQVRSLLVGKDTLPDHEKERTGYGTRTSPQGWLELS